MVLNNNLGNDNLVLQHRNPITGAFEGNLMQLALENGDLTITGSIHQSAAGDIAESFPVDAGQSQIESGYIVTADLESDLLAAVKLSGKRYDSRVVGIVSGAGNLKAGYVLNPPGTTDTDLQSVPVALKGRVYCRVSAEENGPIRKGDFIVSSDVPGTGMRADDGYEGASVVGMALEGIERGEGLILVLVK